MNKDLELSIIESKSPENCGGCGLKCKIYDIRGNYGSFSSCCKNCSKVEWGLTELEFKQILIDTITKDLILPYIFHFPKFETVYYYAKKINIELYSPYSLTEELIRKYFQNYVEEFPDSNGSLSLKTLLETVTNVTLLYDQLDYFQHLLKMEESCNSENYFIKIRGEDDDELIPVYEYLELKSRWENVFAIGIINQDISDVEAFREGDFDVKEQYLAKKGEECLLLIDDYSRVVISFKASITKRCSIYIHDDREPQLEELDEGENTRILRIYSNKVFGDFLRQNLVEVKKINMEQAIKICKKNIICRNPANEEYYISDNALNDGFFAKIKLSELYGDEDAYNTMINHLGDEFLF